MGGLVNYGVQRTTSLSMRFTLFMVSLFPSRFHWFVRSVEETRFMVV